MEKVINIKELRLIVNNLLDYIENTLQKDSIALEKSLYWSIDTESIYDIQNEPNDTNFSIGDLFADWENLENLKENNEYANVMQFRYLASIFRFLSDTDDWFKNTPNTP